MRSPCCRLVYNKLTGKYFAASLSRLGVVTARQLLGKTVRYSTVQVDGEALRD